MLRIGVLNSGYLGSNLSSSTSLLVDLASFNFFPLESGGDDKDTCVAGLLCRLHEIMPENCEHIIFTPLNVFFL